MANWWQRRRRIRRERRLAKQELDRKAVEIMQYALAMATKHDNQGKDLVCLGGPWDGAVLRFDEALPREFVLPTRSYGRASHDVEHVHEYWVCRQPARHVALYCGVFRCHRNELASITMAWPG